MSPKEYFKDVNEIKFDSLSIFVTKEIDAEKFKQKYLSFFAECYLISRYRFFSVLSNVVNPSNLVNDRYPITTYITSDYDLMLEFLRKSGREWVTEERLKTGFGFVSFKEYVSFYDKDKIERALPPSAYLIDGLSHEFTHILFNKYHGEIVRREYEFCTHVFIEGIAVLLNNQYKYPINMIKDIESFKKLDHNAVNLNSLRKGLMLLDKRYVHENFEYQYVAFFTQLFDKALFDKIGKGKYKPLKTLFEFVKNEIKGASKNIYISVYEQYKIDSNEIESRMRKELGLKLLEKENTIDIHSKNV